MWFSEVGPLQQTLSSVFSSVSGDVHSLRISFNHSIGFSLGGLGIEVIFVGVVTKAFL